MRIEVTKTVVVNPQTRLKRTAGRMTRFPTDEPPVAIVFVCRVSEWAWLCHAWRLAFGPDFARWRGNLP